MLIGSPDYDIHVRNTGGYDVFYSLSLLEKLSLLAKEKQGQARSNICSLFQRSSNNVYGKIPANSSWVKVFSATKEMEEKLEIRILEEFSKIDNRCNEANRRDMKKQNLYKELTEYAKVSSF